MHSKTNSFSSLAFAIVVASLVFFPKTTQAFFVGYTQNPSPFEAIEDTSGHIGFLNVSNLEENRTASIIAISVAQILLIGGEFDDQATNVKILGPFPTEASPLVLGPGTNFNIKFSWDAVDTIKDNDVDFGLWQVRFLLTGFDETTNAYAFLRVDDTPIPAALPLFATGLGALALLGWRRKRKAI